MPASLRNRADLLSYSANHIVFKRLLYLSVATAALSAPLHAQGAPIDWDAIQTESVKLLREYVRVNTTNPPGNELAAAHWLKSVLEKDGITATILDTTELGPNRANIYARLKGNGSKKAIALVHHMDVVPVTPEYWTSEPFGADIKDGFVYGRGTLDMKGQAIAQLMTILAIKRAGVPLTRDIVFIGNSNEESGGTGSEQFVKAHADLIRDVEYLFTEGGDNPVVNGKVRYYGVGIEEKRTYWTQMVVKGIPSHGSRPTKQNPVPRLIAALDRLAKYETPLHIVPGVQNYFRSLAPSYSGEQRVWLADVRKAVSNPRARAWLTSDVYWNAIMRNTISLTQLAGSSKVNVIPAEASAFFDARLLPDQDPAAFLADLTRVIADTAVHLIPPATVRPALSNPVNTDLFRAIERATHDRDAAAVVTTPMFTAATDRPFYRTLGIITYGFDPFKVESSDMQKGMHGNDERISVVNMGFGVRYLFDVIRYAQ